jgi:hypothetical protein
MKTTAQNKLLLAKETVRRLHTVQHGPMIGGKSATDDTDPFQCPTGTCPSIWSPCL